MELPASRETEHILVLDEQAESRVLTSSSIAAEIPSAIVQAVESVEALRRAFESRNFDVVVIDQQINGTGTIELLHELRMREDEPSVLVVSASADPRAIAAVYNNGGQRCIVKDGEWLPELGSTVRQALRFRRLQEMNRELHERLVETNMLLEEKNKRLDEFTATVAHDIRGPLGGLSMKLDFILEKWGATFDPTCQKLLHNGFLSLERLNRIVHGMYGYAKLGSAAAEMKFVALETLVNEVISDMNFDAARDVRIELGDLPQVWGNDELLRRVFLNLFNNAIKYNDSKEIVIRVGVAGTVTKELGAWCEIFVEDNGRGIPAEERHSVFGMFQRGSSAGKDTDGTGVGLAAVQRILEIHRGSIRVDSAAEGSGARFLFMLPTQKFDAVQQFAQR